MLKMTGIKLELMTDVHMFQPIEKGMRGGISYTANRHLEANNPYRSGYNAKKPNKYIMYLDGNNLYGCVTSQYLPTGGFKWLPDNKIGGLDLASIPEDSKKGLILEVDLEYPEELHDLHNDYPCAPEKMKVTKDMLSPYCKETTGQIQCIYWLGIKTDSNFGRQRKGGATLWKSATIHVTCPQA